MEQTNQFTAGARMLLVLAAFVIVVAGMRVAESILVPFLLSIFIAIISAPPLFWMQRRGVPTSLSLLIVVAVILAAGTGVVVLIGTSLNEFTRQLPEYQTRLQEQMGGIMTWLGEHGFAVSPDIREHLNPGAVMQLVSGLLSGLGAALTNGFLILLTVIFILLEASSFPAKLKAAMGKSGERLKDFRKITGDINRYMALKTLISVVTGVLVAVWLMILGVDFALLWGLLAFLLNYVPNIGSIIAAIPAVLLASIQLGWLHAGLVALGYLAVNVIMGNAVEPRLMGRRLGLSTLVVFLSLVFWGWVLGPVGMLLSVPLTMTIKIALQAHPDTRWLAILLESEVIKTEADA